MMVFVTPMAAAVDEKDRLVEEIKSLDRDALVRRVLNIEMGVMTEEEGELIIFHSWDGGVRMPHIKWVGIGRVTKRIGSTSFSNLRASEVVPFVVL
jgi:hypothetical protein